MKFTEAKNEFFGRLGESCYMVLATCAEDYPLASTMTCVMFDGAIWMQTDKKFPKYEQIEKNNKVALCISSTQIEGVATFNGHPQDEQNAKFLELLNKHHKNTTAMYSKVPTQVVIKVTPHKAIDWLYEAGSPEIIHLDFINQTVEIQKYKK